MASEAKRSRLENSGKTGNSKCPTGDGAEFISNPHIASMETDVLYHLALDNKNNDLEAMFSDVKFVCMGGSRDRMKQFAELLIKELNYPMPAGHALTDIAGGSDRYVLYKVGPVLTASHGMGVPSLSIILHELLKILHHARCKDVTFFRVGSSGGLGVPPGSVVVTQEAVDGLLQPHMSVPILGKLEKFPAHLDTDLIRELMTCVKSDDLFETHTGKTMCTNDFYEGQGRLDGAFCDYTEADKIAFLKNLKKEGIVNIEMEALCFAAMCQRAGVKGAVVCVTFLDRLLGDQVSTPHATLQEWVVRPETIVIRYIKKQLAKQATG